MVFSLHFPAEKNVVHHQLVYTKTRRKQPMPNNSGVKVLVFNLKRTVISVFENYFESSCILLFTLPIKFNKISKF